MSASDRRALKLKRIGADSDSDGVEDGRDSREDKFGENDREGEFEIKGPVQSFADSVIVIREVSYRLSKGTRFEGSDFSWEDIEPGVCLEVKGLTTQGENQVQKVEKEDDCTE